MIPLVSCLSLSGRCRYCKVKFGYGHALFECAFGLVFVLLVYKYLGPSFSPSLFDVKSLLFQLVIAIILGVIFLYDLTHKIIPKYFLYLFLTLSLVPLFYRFGESGSFSVFAGPIVVALPYLVLFLLTLGKGVGFGDVLLFFGVGSIFGLEGGLLVFLLSLWIGTITVVPLLYFKIVTKKTAIPFAPFIIIAYYLVLFTGWKIDDLIMLVYRIIL